MITVADIHETLIQSKSWYEAYIKEYTYNGMRADSITINFDTRQIRAFEIKTSRSDFLRDKKWSTYSEFCSTLVMVCPAGLILKEEIEPPLGLLWVFNEKRFDNIHVTKWIRRPKNFQSRNGLAWIYTYMRVIEKEFPRVISELNKYKKGPIK